MITKEDKRDLITFLKEYLALFKDNKQHKKIHKKEPCPKCERVKELLRKLK